MNRADLQSLARLRLREARALRDHRLWSGCYYLTGYAVECALKACIARLTPRYDFPEKKRVDKSHTHDLVALLKAADLESALLTDMKVNLPLERNWTVVKDWKVEARYNGSMTAQEALDLYGAVTQQRTGVLAWLRQHW